MARKNLPPLEPGLAAFYSFIAILFPPVAVGMADGCTGNIALNLLLWILGIIPGWLHAYWVIAIRVRGPVNPPLPIHNGQQGRGGQEGQYNPNNYYDPGRLESQLEATVIGPMKTGRMPEGATIHIAPVGSGGSPPGYAAGHVETRQQRITG